MKVAIPRLHLRHLVLVRPPWPGTPHRPRPRERLVQTARAARLDAEWYASHQSLSTTLAVAEPPKTNNPPSLRPRNLQHLDRRLATHHPRPPPPNLQQRPPPARLANLGRNPARAKALCETGYSGHDVPPRHHWLWCLDALVPSVASYQGHGYWRLWQFGADGVGRCGAFVGDGGGEGEGEGEEEVSGFWVVG